MFSSFNAIAKRAQLVQLFAVAVIPLALAGCFSSGSSSDSDSASETELDQASNAEPIEFGDDYWAELAQEYPAYVPEPGIGAAVDADERINKGRWGDVIEWPEIAVGAANMTDGRIVTWASESTRFFGETTEATVASIFDPITETFEDAGYSGHNLFCAGISMLPDGRVFVAGGGVHVSTVSVFEDNEFHEIDSMAMSRWYPTSTTLPSGQVLTSLGTSISGFSELWTDGYGWKMLDNVDLSSAYEFPYYYNDWYPALNVAPDGSLFHAGPNNELFSINFDLDDAITAHGAREGDTTDRLYNTTVLYDIGKMLIAGGGQLNAKNTALTVDLNGATPVVASTNSMEYARTMQNSLVLPNGEVLVIGGNTSGRQFSDEGSVVTPELWNPESGQWRQLAAHEVPRNYHSTALLLQDARVISMGGGLCNCNTDHLNGEIFEPPYLFDTNGEKADRPTIDTGPITTLAGDSITLTGSNDIEKFNMVRLVAMTHHHSTDQRLVPVEFSSAIPGSYQLELNANVNVLIPGYYWIFGLDGEGVPSMGHQIQVQVTAPVVESPEVTDTNVNYAYYEGVWDALPNFAALTPVATGTQADYSVNNRLRNQGYGFVFTGSITVPVSSYYTFYLSSDDGSRLSIDGDVVVNHDGVHKFESEQEGSVYLSAGTHAVKLEYFENAGADGLLLSWSRPGVSKQPVTAADLGSAVVVDEPEVNTPTVVVTPIVLAQDLVSYKYFEGDWNQLPDFDSLTSVKTGTLDTISLSPKMQDNFYAFQFDVRISVETAGAYSFYTQSDDGSRLYVDNQLVVDNDGLHPVEEKAGIVTLTAGEHDVRVEYFEKAGGDSLEVLWSGPGVALEALPKSVFVEPSLDSLVTAAAESTVDKMQFEIFEGLFTTLAGLDGLTPDEVGDTDAFDLSVASGINLYGVKYTGQVQVDVADTYTFTLASDDGGRLYIDGNLIIDNDGQHPIIEKQNSVALTQGLHDIRVEYFQSGGGANLEVLWASQGQVGTTIAATLLYSPDATASDVTGVVVPAVTTDVTTSGYTVSSDWGYDLYYGSWNALPDFDSLAPAWSGVTSVLDLSVSPFAVQYGVRFTGTIEVDTAGVYTFYSASDDGSKVLVNGQVVVSNDGLHPTIEKQGAVTLAAGVHDIVLTYFQGPGGQSFEASWAGPDFAKTTLLPGDSAVTDVQVQSTGSLSAQLTYDYFEGDWAELPNFSTLTPVRSGVVNNFLTSVKGAANQYGVSFNGSVEVETAGAYTFYVVSNDGSRLSIGGQEVVDNDGRHGAIEKEGAITLAAGLHAIQLDYFQNGGSEALNVYWSGPGFDKQLLPDAVLFYQP